MNQSGIFGSYIATRRTKVIPVTETELRLSESVFKWKAIAMGAISAFVGSVLGQLFMHAVRTK